MRQIWSIASKELRGYFNSAVAVIFLATFLFVAMFTFFWGNSFFTNNRADITPLFEALPVLLIFLVAALTMRLWSDEHKTGTIEILLTLPVPVYRLVIGKFLAGLILVAVALGLTLGLPITVSMMGNLDWGPVVGGGGGPLLLASAYLAVGLAISANTDNQIVALIATLAVGGLLYLPGDPLVAGVFGVEVSEFLRLIGTGSRFESVARGVLDIRDLAYYAGLVGLFLTLNTVLIEARRWSTSERTQQVRSNARTAVLLVAGNALALNLWLQPVTAARVDLTEDQMYSLSEPTEKLLNSLQEPLVLRGYFSDNAHPLLVPLVPEIRNILNEYQIAGGSNVQVEVVDPSKDDELAEEALQQYDIRSIPFQFAGRHEQSIVNAYFHVLVAYGDQYKVLTVGDLIKVDVVDVNNVQAYLDNLEYEITKVIRKVVYEFQSIEAVFARLPDTVELRAYVTDPDTLPEQLKELPTHLDAIANELEAQSNGKFEYNRTAPSSEDEQTELFQNYGIRPYSTSLFGGETFYAHMIIKLGDRIEAVPLPDREVNQATLNRAIRSSIERVTPGFTTVVGLVTPPPKVTNPAMPGMQAPPPVPLQHFRTLSQTLGETYTVRPITLGRTPIPDDVDVLVIAGPDTVGPDSGKTVDQFLMRGGSIVALVGKRRLDLEASQTGRIALTAVNTGMDEMLAAYGIEVADTLVLDDENSPFPMPSTRTVGGMPVQVIDRLAYPFFVRVDSDGMDEDSIITKGLGPVVMHWPSPVKATVAGAGEQEGEANARTVETLLVASDQSWLQASTDIQPNFARFPETGFGRPEAAASAENPPHALAMAITGTFDSAFPPEEKDDTDILGDADDSNKKDIVPQRQLERSTPDARIVVVGSSSFVADTALAVSEQAGTRDIANNLKFVQNLVDWAVADTDLLTIRTRGSTARTLSGVAEEERINWEIVNYVIALVALFVVVGIARVRRRSAIDRANKIIVPTAVNAPKTGSKDNDSKSSSPEQEQPASSKNRDQDKNKPTRSKKQDKEDA